MVAAAGAAGVAGLQWSVRRMPPKPSRGEHQWAMVIDQSKCTGCGYCVMACRAHNDVSPRDHLESCPRGRKVGDKKVYLPRPCMQCEKAPCVDVCLVGASYYRPDGIVMMDYDRCIGCRYCEVACPYGARSFNWKEFTAPTRLCRNGVNPKWNAARAVCLKSAPSATSASTAAWRSA